jgi:hypothetical protein
MRTKNLNIANNFIIMTNFYPTSKTVSVTGYPYGFRKRTTAFFSVEHKKGKGFRQVFQTIHPEKGTRNKPKKSTYSPVVVMMHVEGKVKYKHLHFYDDEGKQKDIAFMHDNYHLFTEEQIKDIAITILGYLKADIYAKVTYCGSDQEKMLPLYEGAIEALVEIANTGKNLFDKVIVDWESVRQLEVKDYQPFKVTNYSI